MVKSVSKMVKGEISVSPMWWVLSPLSKSV